MKTSFQHIQRQNSFCYPPFQKIDYLEAFGIPVLRRSSAPSSPLLERLSLWDDSSTFWTLQSPDSEEFFVQFTTKMSRLVCCCIVFADISPEEEKRINQLITEKVGSNRPSLWFSVCNIASDEDPTLPFVHYLEMIESERYYPLPEC